MCVCVCVCVLVYVWVRVCTCTSVSKQREIKITPVVLSIGFFIKMGRGVRHFNMSFLGKGYWGGGAQPDDNIHKPPVLRRNLSWNMSMQPFPSSLQSFDKYHIEIRNKPVFPHKNLTKYQPFRSISEGSTSSVQFYVLAATLTGTEDIDPGPAQRKQFIRIHSSNTYIVHNTQLIPCNTNGNIYTS